MGEVSPSCYGMSFTNVGKASPPPQKNWFKSFYQMETVKEGETATFVLWNVPFIDLRKLNKCGRDFASLLFCFVFVA